MNSKLFALLPGLTVVDESSSTVPFHVYPNPVQNQLYLESDGEWQDASVTILNALGQTVQMVTAMSGNKLSIDTEGLKNGIYWLQLRSGQQRFSQLFVKQQ